MGEIERYRLGVPLGKDNPFLSTAHNRMAEEIEELQARDASMPEADTRNYGQATLDENLAAIDSTATVINYTRIEGEISPPAAPPDNVKNKLGLSGSQGDKCEIELINDEWVLLRLATAGNDRNVAAGPGDGDPKTLIEKLDVNPQPVTTDVATCHAWVTPAGDEVRIASRKANACLCVAASGTSGPTVSVNSVRDFVNSHRTLPSSTVRNPDGYPISAGDLLLCEFTLGIGYAEWEVRANLSQAASGADDKFVAAQAGGTPNYLRAVLSHTNDASPPADYRLLRGQAVSSVLQLQWQQFNVMLAVLSADLSSSPTATVSLGGFVRINGEVPFTSVTVSNPIGFRGKTGDPVALAYTGGSPAWTIIAVNSDGSGGSGKVKVNAADPTEDYLIDQLDNVVTNPTSGYTLIEFRSVVDSQTGDVKVQGWANPSSTGGTGTDENVKINNTDDAGKLDTKFVFGAQDANGYDVVAEVVGSGVDQKIAFTANQRKRNATARVAQDFTTTDATAYVYQARLLDEPGGLVPALEISHNKSSPTEVANPYSEFGLVDYSVLLRETGGSPAWEIVDPTQISDAIGRAPIVAVNGSLITVSPSSYVPWTADVSLPPATITSAVSDQTPTVGDIAIVSRIGVQSASTDWRVRAIIPKLPGPPIEMGRLAGPLTIAAATNEGVNTTPATVSVPLLDTSVTPNVPSQVVSCRWYGDTIQLASGEYANCVVSNDGNGRVLKEVNACPG